MFLGYVVKGSFKCYFHVKFITLPFFFFFFPIIYKLDAVHSNLHFRFPLHFQKGYEYIRLRIGALMVFSIKSLKD